MSQPRDTEFVLTLSCRDTAGIVHAVSGLLYQAGCNIIDSQQFGDLQGADATQLFFMRVHFEAPPPLADAAALNALFGNLRARFGMDAKVHAMARRPRLTADGQPARPLPERPAVSLAVGAAARRHPGHRLEPCRLRAAGQELRHRLSTTCRCRAQRAEARRAQEREIEALIERERIDLVVLARYMQILSAEFCRCCAGARSTSTTASCPASRARGRTSRRTSAASS